VAKFDVHLWVLARVKVEGVEAETHEAAIVAAQDRFYEGAHEYFRDDRPRGLDAAEVELADGEPPAYYLVDEHGDKEHERSRYYCSDGQTELLTGGGCCAMCVRPLAGVQESQKEETVNV
jgi:hypothetical protein